VEAAGTVAYLDFKAGQPIAHVRFGSIEFAEAAINLSAEDRVIGGMEIKLALLAGAREEIYLRESAQARQKVAPATQSGGVLPKRQKC